MKRDATNGGFGLFFNFLFGLNRAVPVSQYESTIFNFFLEIYISLGFQMCPDISVLSHFVAKSVLPSYVIRARLRGSRLQCSQRNWSLVPQRHQRINPRRTPCGNPTSNKRYARQQQQNQLSYYQNGQAPKSVAFHKPRGKSMEFLATVAKLAGAYVPENKGKGDVLVYAGDEETTARAKKLLEEVDIEAQTLSVRAALLEFTEGDNSSKSLSLALSAFPFLITVA